MSGRDYELRRTLCRNVVPMSGCEECGLCGVPSRYLFVTIGGFSDPRNVQLCVSCARKCGATPEQSDMTLFGLMWISLPVCGTAKEAA